MWKIGNEKEIYVLYMVFHKILFIFVKIDDQSTIRQTIPCPLHISV